MAKYILKIINVYQQVFVFNWMSLIKFTGDIYKKGQKFSDYSGVDCRKIWL